ncbi:MAG: MerR family transcriptional regulator [Flavobacterium sp. BFFFF1]|uniref:MerR family transcriptional regulator n=1 Tax=unclassified Flavobacterium TaxID=196869 RepID=UPI000BD3A047|nr:MULTISPECIES: MerR family transcriptional regulator [unclassified Flavobacterium]OYU80559.1 MAG: MerR family transcriptional regulator [Flavobacterium sp. BFFFF1]
MSNTKSAFNIKDLEHISGIKAHTIRIWEKRYNILQPSRTETNIRLYSLESLQKLLNITLLHNHGYKISKIATYPEETIPSLVKEIFSPNNSKNHAINSFKVAMLQFDRQLFLKTYDSMLAQRSFREIFNNVFIPLLNEIGVLWQTQTITPAHEHFISSLIRQKLILNIDKIQSETLITGDRTLIFYLPANDNHEMGLLYMHYEAILNGYKTVYLGADVTLEDLKNTLAFHKDATFVTYFTLLPEDLSIEEYFSAFSREILEGTGATLWASGCKVLYTSDKQPDSGISIIHSFADYIKRL